METIEYKKRSDLVAALRDFRKQGIEVDVVENGKTLRFPNGIGATPEEVAQAEADENEDALLGVVEPEPEVEVEGEIEAPADGIEKTPVEGDTLEDIVDEDEDLIGEVETTPTTPSKRKRNRS